MCPRCPKYLSSLDEQMHGIPKTKSILWWVCSKLRTKKEWSSSQNDKSKWSVSHVCRTESQAVSFHTWRKTNNQPIRNLDPRYWHTSLATWKSQSLVFCHQIQNPWELLLSKRLQFLQLIQSWSFAHHCSTFGTFQRHQSRTSPDSTPLMRKKFEEIRTPRLGGVVASRFRIYYTPEPEAVWTFGSTPQKKAWKGSFMGHYTYTIYT